MFIIIITFQRNVLTVALLLRCCVRLSSSVCIVAKRCVLQQKLQLTAYKKSYMRNRLVPKRMTLIFVRDHLRLNFRSIFESKLYF